MPTHRPDLALMPLTWVAFLASTKRQTARKRLDQAGLKPERTDGRTLLYNSRAALKILLGGDDLDLNAERARLAKEQADGLELRNAQARGELLPAADLDHALIALAGIVTQRLNAIPTKAAPELRAAKSEAEAAEIVKRHIDDACTELADAGRACAEQLEEQSA